MRIVIDSVGDSQRGDRQMNQVTYFVLILAEHLNHQLDLFFDELFRKRSRVLLEALREVAYCFRVNRGLSGFGVQLLLLLARTLPR